MSDKQELQKAAKLILEDGTEFSGWAFGKSKSAAGEIIFNTGMSGIVQAITDPACKGQIYLSTWTLPGNCGVPVNKNGKPFLDEKNIPLELESEKIQVSGLVISDLCEQPSHYSSNLSLSSWLEKQKIPGIFGIDTRAVALRIKDRGTMRAKILVDDKTSGDVSFNKINTSNHNGVSLNEIAAYSPGAEKKGIKIALIDCGVKANVIRCLLKRGAEVIRIPCNIDFSNIDYDALLISSGPGDPKNYKKLIDTVRASLSSTKPIFGIGLGNLIIALAAGADIYKLPFGHRSQNQPCIDSDTGRCYVTSQNHGWTVRPQTLSEDWEIWFTNANDNTIEGIRHKSKPFCAVQFYPEGCPGSRDLESLFDLFIDQIKEKK